MRYQRVSRTRAEQLGKLLPAKKGRKNHARDKALPGVDPGTASTVRHVL